jgi:hypothetical protein
MFLDHYGINTSGLLESQKGKTSRATRGITHNGARIDFSKLREVSPEGFCVQYLLLVLQSNNKQRIYHLLYPS